MLVVNFTINIFIFQIDSHCLTWYCKDLQHYWNMVSELKAVKPLKCNITLCCTFRVPRLKGLKINNHTMIIIHPGTKYKKAKIFGVHTVKLSFTVGQGQIKYANRKAHETWYLIAIVMFDLSVIVCEIFTVEMCMTLILTLRMLQDLDHGI